MPQHTCLGHRDHVLCTAWSPDGNTSSHYTYTLTYHHSHASTHESRPPAWSPDGNISPRTTNTLAFVHCSTHSYKLDTLPPSYSPNTQIFTCTLNLIFFPGALFVSADRSGEIRIWDPKTGLAKGTV